MPFVAVMKRISLTLRPISSTTSRAAQTSKDSPNSTFPEFYDNGRSVTESHNRDLSVRGMRFPRIFRRMGQGTTSDLRRAVASRVQVQGRHEDSLRIRY